MSDERDYWELICHGDEERCLTVRDTTMPICARCFGFYSGILGGVVIGALTIPQIKTVSSTVLFLTTVLASLPLLIDGTLQKFSRWESKNWLRLSTGAAIGTVIGFDILWMLSC